jgi:hypothetical protein
MRIFLLLLFLYVTPCVAQYGCTDPLATNYDITAQQNDGSCTYPNVSVTPELSVVLDASLSETSGLIFWDNRIWTHNDNADNKLYALNANVFQIEFTPSIENAINTDWEEIAQDSLYLYIGDFGNNQGNRTDLHILRVLKSSFLNPPLLTDTIWFQYEDQTDFTPGSQTTNFDCEAMVVRGDSIYLFTKEWTSLQTTVYRIPSTPGNYQAENLYAYNVNGLITGATWNDSLQCIALSGYSPLLQPFIYLLYDFTDNLFFTGNKRKVGVGLPFHQIEGLTFVDPFTLVVTNENFQQSVINVNQKIHTLNLYSFFVAPNFTITSSTPKPIIYPNPSKSSLTIPGFSGGFQIRNSLGLALKKGKLRPNESVDVSEFPAGLYFMYLEDYKRSFQFIINK